MNNALKIKPLWVFASVIALGVLGSWLLDKRPPTSFRRFVGGDLLAYATPIVPKAKAPFTSGYQWTPSGNLYVIQEGEYRSKREEGTGPLPTLVDGKTGLSAPMTSFLNKVDEVDTLTNSLNFQEGHCASPDGRWLVFATHKNHRPVWQVTASDGSRRLFWPRIESEKETSHAGWTADSQQWIEAIGRPGGWQFLVHHIGTSQLTTLPVVWPDTYSENHFDATGLLGITRSGSLIARTSEENTEAAPGFFDFTFLNNRAVAHFHQVSLPPQAMMSEVVLEPQNGRLAWLFQFDRRSWWGRHLPGQFTRNVPENKTMGLCTSRLDGTDMREIAPEYRISGRAGQVNWIPYNIQWTPDGKSVSFSYGNSLYTVRDE